MLHLHILFSTICLCTCVLPAYTPALNKQGDFDREDLIRSYFLQGYTNSEIVGFLALQHGVILSVRTVKRILQRMGLKRASVNHESPIELLVNAIVEELENSCGSFMGYRQFTRHLRKKYHLTVRRDTIMQCLRVIDPEGVDRRKRRRLKRRRYTTPGPNFLWHVDGWDKLAPFGIFIHGAMDGFSRRILWLEVNSTNKNPRVIASHYLDTVEQLGGVPKRLRCDKGTENVVIGTLQQFFRWNDDDDFAGSKSFVERESSGNQRIEAWWSKFRERGGGWWVNLFKDLRDAGLYTANHLNRECLKFCFLPILRKELYLVTELWNSHNIQKQKRCEVEGGKPDILFFTPEIYGSHNYLVDVNIDDVNACKEMYAENCQDYSEDLEELVRLIKPNYVPPSDEREALALYCEITNILKNY